ncbi:MAG: ATP-binding cassette domain-containing protein, partial [Myxococcota bacterium]
MTTSSTHPGTHADIAAKNAAVVQCQDICVERRGTRVLEDISFQVPASSFVGLVGPNGAGKTTLLKTMLGLIQPSSGTIHVLGRPPGRNGGAPSGVGYVPQRHAIAQYFPASVYDIVAMGRMRGLQLFSRLSSTDRDAIAKNLEVVAIADLASRP